MAVRYMGTKRHIARRVEAHIRASDPDGRVVDLFSGMGNVSAALVGYRSIVANDALEFAASMSRARFMGDRKRSHASLARSLRPTFVAARDRRRTELAKPLSLERKAMSGSATDLRTYMDGYGHVGSSQRVAADASERSKLTGYPHYQLARLYFAGGYCSLQQAIELDALRECIDTIGREDERDWLLAAWLSAFSIVINAPGHTAQYLKPNTVQAATRIVRTWQREIWELFADQLRVIAQVGDSSWRAENEVFSDDALDLLASPELANVGAIYADPPYTKDQYSRFYHVYETLFRYDFPTSSGLGRARDDRFSTGFSLKSQVVNSFVELFDRVAARHVPLVLSYPSDGLLTAAGGSVLELASEKFRVTTVDSFQYDHSTMGASSGSKSKNATENVYVCTPR